MRHLASLFVLFGLVACGGSDAATGGAGGAGGASAGGMAGMSSAGASTGGASAGGAGGASAGTSSGGTGSSGAGAAGASAAGSNTGGSSAGGASNGGASNGGGPSFAAVQAIFDAHCVTCHDKSKRGLPTYPQLSLVAGDAHAALVNVPALEPCGGTYVVPGDPAHSYLMHKLTDTMPCDGAHMPAPFEVIKPPPLSAAELATISGWISAGAH